MLAGNTRFAILDNYHGTADSSSVTRNKHSAVVVVDIYAHEFTHTPRTPQLTERGYKVSRIPRKTDNRAVDVHDVGMRTVNLRTSCKSNICEIRYNELTAM